MKYIQKHDDYQFCAKKPVFFSMNPLELSQWGWLQFASSRFLRALSGFGGCGRSEKIQIRNRILQTKWIRICNTEAKFMNV
jgi:hypothetical protein